MEDGKIIDSLKRFSREIPASVIENLAVGDVVGKSMGLSYFIDDKAIDLQLGQFPEGAIPYSAVYRKLSPSMAGINKQFNGRRNIPFSEVFNAGVGECLEKAVLIQLASQRKENSFLINGVIEEDGVVGAGPHAYNVVVRNGKPFLIDAQNPTRVDAGGKIHPYVAPIVDISGDYGEIKTTSEWRMGRSYSIV
jgi:hypothetical protein